MSFAVKTRVPGSILVKKMRSGNEYIYYREYKYSGEWRASRLRYTKKNIKVVEQILEHLYKEKLSKENKLDYSLTVNTTIVEQFQYFMEGLERKGLTKSTMFEYGNSYRMIINGNYPPDDNRMEYINGRQQQKYRIEDDIEEYINSTTHKNNTINKNLRQIQIFVKYLSENSELPNLNVYNKYKVKSEQKEIVPYSKKEAKMILQKAKERDEVLYLLLMLMYLTGARVYEWLRAYFSKGTYRVDLKNKEITFSNKVRRDQSQTIPITSKVEPIILRLKELEEARSDYKDKVIPYSETGKSHVIKKVTAIEKELGIKKRGRSTHGFRRLLATELFEKEIPIDIIKDIMRHSSIDVTLNAYRKHDKKRITDSLDKLDR